MHHISFIFLAILLITGCTSNSDNMLNRLTTDVPIAWKNGTKTSGDSPNFWWQNFRDETLNQAIGEALESNPNLQTAGTRLEIAWAQSKISAADLFPQIALSNGLSTSQMNMAQFGVSLPNVPSKFNSQRHNLTLGAQWELDLWGRIRAGKKAARANALSQAADFAGARHSLAGQLAKAWMLSIESRQQLRLARSTVTTYETTVERIRARFEQGVRSSLDLRLATASLAAANANVAERIYLANRTTRQLEILLGKIPENQLKVPEKLPLIPSTIPVGIPAEILSRRPDIVAAEQNLKAAGANVEQAKASLYPQISLTSSTGTSTSDLSDLVSGDSLIWNIGANIIQPLFQGGRLRQNVKIQQANLKAAESNFRSVFISALGEVENALDSEVQLVIMDTSLEEANEQSKAAANIAQERYDQGLENIITLLEARRRSIEAESRWWSIRRQRIDNRINLHLALGGGFKTSSNYISNY